MLPDDLIRMANQIAHFFAPYPEADAILSVRDHLVKFWDPSMRRGLVALAAQRSGELHPLVQRALEGLSVGLA